MRGIKRNQLKYDCYEKPKKSHKRIDEEYDDEEEDAVADDRAASNAA